MGATTKLNIGKIPVSKGEYQEGTAYQRLNQVTMLGSTYQSKIDGNTSAPAQMGADGAVENINTDKWLCIAVGNVSSARKVVYNNETSGLEADNVQEAIDEVNKEILCLDNFTQSEDVTPEIAIENKYIDAQGNFQDYNGYFISAPIKLEAGKMIYVKLIANDVTPLALSDSTINNDSKVTPLFGYKNLNTHQKFVYTAKEDCYVVVCGRSSASVKVKIITDPDNTLSINDELAKKANAEDVSSQIQTEQERVNAELTKKFDKVNIVQQIGNAKDKVVSQRLIQLLDNYINLYKNKEVIVPSIAIKGYYIEFDGSFTEYSTYNVSSPIQLNAKETIIIKMISNVVVAIALCEGNTITKEDNLTPVLNAPNNNKEAYYKYTATENCYVVFCGRGISEKTVVYKTTGFSLSLMDIDDNLKAIESDVDNINTKNNEYDKKLEEYDKKLEEYDNKSILHLNPKDTVGNNILQATRQYNNNQAQLSNKLCTLSVLTDIHGYQGNLQRYIDFTNEYKSYVDDMLCLGDTISDSWVNTMDFFNNVKGSEKILLTIGNHDTCDRTQNPVVWYQYAGKQAYDRYFAPYVENWKVVQPENAATNGYCWYYKDYNTAKVRLVVLDCMYVPKDSEKKQLQWFTSVLTDAKEKGLSVVAAKHYPFSVVQDKDANTFNSLDFNSYDGNSKSSMKDFLDAIETFISNGGEFICWLNGDSHYDFQGLITNYPNQYAIAFENAGLNSLWNDSVRIESTKSQDSFNFVTFDTNTKLIKVVRVGNNSDRYLRHKNYICYDYKNKKIITCE